MVNFDPNTDPLQIPYNHWEHQYLGQGGNQNLLSMLLQTQCNFGVEKDPTLQLTHIFLLCYSKVNMVNSVSYPIQGGTPEHFFYFTRLVNSIF